MERQVWEYKHVVYCRYKDGHKGVGFWDITTMPVNSKDLSMEDGLYDLGQECWEMVSHNVVSEEDVYLHFFTFKRPEEF